MTTLVKQKRLVIAGALVALAVPALSACNSFDYATDRPNEITHGGSTLDGAVRVNAARIVTAQEGTGILVGTFSLDPAINPASTGKTLPTVTAIETAADATKTVTPESFKTIELPDSGIINLADPANGGIAVTGDFKPGDSIPMTFTFSEGEAKTISVPVVSQCGAYVDVVAAADEPKKPAKKGTQATDQSSEGATAEGTEEGASTLPADAPEGAEGAEGEHAESGAEGTESEHAESGAEGTESEHAESGAEGTESEHAESESGHAGTEDPYSCEFPEAALPGAEEGH